MRLQLPEDGHDFRFDGIVEFAAILRPIVEASPHPVSIGDIVWEPSIASDLMTDPNQLIEEGIEAIRFTDPPIRHQLPGLLAHGPIGFFLKAPHGHEGFLLTPKFHRQTAAELVVFVAHLGLFGLQGNILRTVQFGLKRCGPVKDLVLGPRQLGPKRVLQEQFRHGELAGLERRIDDLHEMQVSLLGLGIVGMAGLGDVPTGPLLIESSGQFAGIQQPLLQVGHCGATGRPGLQLIKERSDGLPVSQSQGCRHEAAGAKRRQFTEGQEAHGPKPWKPTLGFASLAG